MVIIRIYSPGTAGHTFLEFFDEKLAHKTFQDLTSCQFSIVIRQRDSMFSDSLVSQHTSPQNFEHLNFGFFQLKAVGYHR